MRKNYYQVNVGGDAECFYLAFLTNEETGQCFYVAYNKRMCKLDVGMFMLEPTHVITVEVIDNTIFPLIDDGCSSFKITSKNLEELTEEEFDFLRK